GAREVGIAARTREMIPADRDPNRLGVDYVDGIIRICVTGVLRGLGPGEGHPTVLHSRPVDRPLVMGNICPKRALGQSRVAAEVRDQTQAGQYQPTYSAMASGLSPGAWKFYRLEIHGEVRT